MKNAYHGSSVHKKFLPAHLIYLLLCWGVIKCVPCGALWHGCVLWQHRVWPYGRAGVRICLHTLVAEHPQYTYMLLCVQAELATAAHLVFKVIQVCTKWLYPIGSWKVGGDARKHYDVFTLFSSSSITIRCGILAGSLIWPGCCGDLLDSLRVE